MLFDDDIVVVGNFLLRQPNFSLSEPKGELSLASPPLDEDEEVEDELDDDDDDEDDEDDEVDMGEFED